MTLPRFLSQELNAVQIIFLQKGESRLLSFTLGKKSFSYYKESIQAFGMDAGDFEIMIGSSSKQIFVKKKIRISWL